MTTFAGYQAFLADAGVPSTAIPSSFTGTGTLEQNSNVLSIATVAAGALADVFVSDANAAIPADTRVTGQISGPAGGVGTYAMSGAALSTQASPEAITGANFWVTTSYLVALDVVNCAIRLASCRMYDLAVYNLATDRLFNFATDPQNTAFFQTARGKMKLTKPLLGVVNAGSDQGTSGSWITPEFVQNLTLFDLQTLQTPWGRDYMGIAQSWGPDMWGLS